jgi:hypothetical protein
MTPDHPTQPVLSAMSGTNIRAATLSGSICCQGAPLNRHYSDPLCKSLSVFGDEVPHASMRSLLISFCISFDVIGLLLDM